MWTKKNMSSQDSQSFEVVSYHSNEEEEVGDEYEEEFEEEDFVSSVISIGTTSTTIDTMEKTSTTTASDWENLMLDICSESESESFGNESDHSFVMVRGSGDNHKERGKRVKSNTKQRIEDVLAANEKPQFAMVKRNNYEEVVQRVNKHSKMISKAAFSSYYDSKAAKFTQWRGAGCSNGESKK